MRQIETPKEPEVIAELRGWHREGCENLFTIGEVLAVDIADILAAYDAIVAERQATVVVLDEWRVTDKDGVLIATFRTEHDANAYRVGLDDDDEAWPLYAPHRVVRVALVDERVSKAYTLPRVTDEMVERAAGVFYAATIRFPSFEDAHQYLREMYTRTARAAITAALEGPRDE